MIIKICGMRDAANIRDVERLGADMMGFIFYPRSPRYVEFPPEYMPRLGKRVGVFVNANLDEMLYKARAYGLDYIQLHGDESPETCLAIKRSGRGVIRAISIATADDMRRAEEYPMADYMLFDTRTALRGGSGRRFSWDLLSGYRGSVPFLLSGGIGPDALADVLAFRHPMFAGIDLNSAFETAPAVKDVAKLEKFIKQIRAARP